MVALRTLMGAVSGRNYAGMLRETPAGMHAMRWDGPADKLLVVWTEQAGGRRLVEFAKCDLVSATGLMGKDVKSKDRPSGQARVEIDEASSPIYLRLKRR